MGWRLVDLLRTIVDEQPDVSKALRCDIETILEGQVEELDRVIG